MKSLMYKIVQNGNVIPTVLCDVASTKCSINNEAYGRCMCLYSQLFRNLDK